jgi:hypothetical protein
MIQGRSSGGGILVGVQPAGGPELDSFGEEIEDVEAVPTEVAARRGVDGVVDTVKNPVAAMALGGGKILSGLVFVGKGKEGEEQVGADEDEELVSGLEIKREGGRRTTHEMVLSLSRQRGRARLSRALRGERRARGCEGVRRAWQVGLAGSGLGKKRPPVGKVWAWSAGLQGEKEEKG